MDNLLFSVNAVVPIFLIVLSGYVLKRKKIIDDNFVSISQKFVFTLALPALIFRDISKTDIKSLFNFELIAYTVLGTLFVFFATYLLVSCLIKNRQSVGAFVQGVYRSNYAILGLPLILNLFGQSGVAKGAIVLSVVMPLYNVLAVVILTITAPTSINNSVKNIITNILKNPLILAAVAAIPFSYFQIPLPVVVGRTIDYLSDLSIPLALIGIGGTISVDDVRRKLGMSLSATVIKLVIVPLVFTSLAVYLGFSGSDLGVIFVLFASPSAISSFIMARAMNSDSELAAHIVLLTTLGSVLSLFCGVYMMKTFGVI